MNVDLLSLLAVLTLGVLTPGPDFFLVLKHSVGGLRARAFVTVAGITAGLAAQMTAIAIGFTTATPGTLRIVQLVGAGFLAWIGARALFAAGTSRSRPDTLTSTNDGRRSAFLEGLACNVTNPKAFLFYASLYAQLVQPGLSSGWRSGLLIAFVAHAAIVWTLVVLALQSPPVARQLARAQRWLPVAFGIALLALAVWVAWQAW